METCYQVDLCRTMNQKEIPASFLLKNFMARPWNVLGRIFIFRPRNNIYFNNVSTNSIINNTFFYLATFYTSTYYIFIYFLIEFIIFRMEPFSS